jgi:hypothetical protein
MAKKLSGYRKRYKNFTMVKRISLGNPITENIYSSGFMGVGSLTSLVAILVFDKEQCAAISEVGSGSRSDVGGGGGLPLLAAYISDSVIDAQLFAVFPVTVILTYLALTSGKSQFSGPVVLRL